MLEFSLIPIQLNKKIKAESISIMNHQRLPSVAFTLRVYVLPGSKGGEFGTEAFRRPARGTKSRLKPCIN
jgi:hypothetical protein